MDENYWEPVKNCHAKLSTYPTWEKRTRMDFSANTGIQQVDAFVRPTVSPDITMSPVFHVRCVVSSRKECFVRVRNPSDDCANAGHGTGANENFAQHAGT